MRDGSLSAPKFRDRQEAGAFLGERLCRDFGQLPDVAVFGLARGGVVVGYEVARQLGTQLDVLIVRKLGVPGYEELAIGAMATGEICVLNDDLIRRLEIPAETIEAVTAREREELKRREQAYRGHASPLQVTGKVAILVDDGVATGSTMMAAVQAIRRLDPRRVVVAVPVASPSVYTDLHRQADEVVALLVPENFFAVGQWYEDFGQITDAEVAACMKKTGSSRTDVG